MCFIRDLGCCFDPSANSWTEAEPIQHEHSLIVFNHSFYCQITMSDGRCIRMTPTISKLTFYSKYRRYHDTSRPGVSITPSILATAYGISAALPSQPQSTSFFCRSSCCLPTTVCAHSLPRLFPKTPRQLFFASSLLRSWSRLMERMVCQSILQ